MVGTLKLMLAKKSLGQNFLKNDTIIQKIVSLFVCGENDLILEIGPGRGALTKYLTLLPAKIVCIEIDKDMQNYLNFSRAEIIYDDILNVDLNKLLDNYSYDNLYVVGNLPYYITSPIIEKLLNSNIKAHKMVFMVQKEVAERFSSKFGNKEYGYMTVFINHFYDVNYEFMVPKLDFMPAPKVDSAIISLNKKDYKEIPDDFWQFVKLCFRHKRKNLKNNLSNYDIEKINRVLNKYNLDASVRAEYLSEEILWDLYENCKGQ